MSSFFDAVSSQAFMQNAIVGGILASVACGVVGSYVVVKRIGYLAGGIAHSVLGGMGIAYYLGRPPIEGALIAALVFAVILGWVACDYNSRKIRSSARCGQEAWLSEYCSSRKLPATTSTS